MCIGSVLLRYISCLGEVNKLSLLQGIVGFHDRCLRKRKSAPVQLSANTAAKLFKKIRKEWSDSGPRQHKLSTITKPKLYKHRKLLLDVRLNWSTYPEAKIPVVLIFTTLKNMNDAIRNLKLKYFWKPQMKYPWYITPQT